MSQDAVAVEDAAVAECCVGCNVGKGSDVASAANACTVTDFGSRGDDVYEIQCGVLLEEALPVRVVADCCKEIPIFVVCRVELGFFDCRMGVDFATAIGGDDFEFLIADRFGDVDNVFCVAGASEYEKFFAHDVSCLY